MKGDPHKSLQASPEQVVYAGILEKGMYLGLVAYSSHFCALCSWDNQTIYSSHGNIQILVAEC